MKDRKTGQPLGTIGKALTRLGNSGAFYDRGEQATHNVIRGLKTVGRYKEFRELTKDAKGRYQKIEERDFTWDAKTDRWIYKNKVAVQFTDSPFGASVEAI